MNSDKFNTLTSNLVEFVAGERPSADKFNAVNKYFSRSLRELANAIGPIYDKSFPYFDVNTNKETYLTAPYNVFDAQNRSRPLDIANLARLIGPASNLNPRILSGIGENLTEEIPSGVSSYRLKYKNDAFVNIPVVSGGLTENDYVVSADNQIVYFNNPTGNNLSITYRRADYHLNTIAFGGPNYPHSTFNVIPDPNSETNLTITDETTYYKVVLPSINAQQSSLNNLLSSNINDNSEPHLNQQLKLPEWMWNVDLNPGQTTALFTNGTIIPPNFLYLKNRTTGEVYLDAEYTFVNSTEINVSNIDLCLTENPEHKFCIVTVGTDITTSIDDLRVKWFKHTHDGTFGESPIDIKDLAGIFVSQAPRGVIRPSSIASNHLPMYLHRDGYEVDSTHCNGNNAMRGDLVMGLTSFDPLDATTIIYGDNLTTGASSNKILFGTNQAYLQRLNSGELTIRYLRNTSLGNPEILIDGDNKVTLRSIYNDESGLITLDGDTIDIDSNVVTKIQSTDRVEFNINGVNFGDIETSFDLCVDNGQDVNVREDYTFTKHPLVNDQQHYINKNELTAAGSVSTFNQELATSQSTSRKKAGVYSKQISEVAFQLTQARVSELVDDASYYTTDSSGKILTTAHIESEFFNAQSGNSSFSFILARENSNGTRRSFELFQPEFDSYYHLPLSFNGSNSGDEIKLLKNLQEMDLIINRGSLYNQKRSSLVGQLEEIKSTFYFKIPEFTDSDSIEPHSCVYINYGGSTTSGVTVLDPENSPNFTVGEAYTTKNIYTTDYLQNNSGLVINDLKFDISITLEGLKYEGHAVNGNNLFDPSNLNTNNSSKNGNIQATGEIPSRRIPITTTLEPEVFKFKQNAIYKVEETYFNGKIWLNITGA